MAESEDVRWKPRFESYVKTLVLLRRFIAKEELNELEGLGLIKAFGYAYERSWNILYHFLKKETSMKLYGPRDIL